MLRAALSHKPIVEAIFRYLPIISQMSLKRAFDIKLNIYQRFWNRCCEILSKHCGIDGELVMSILDKIGDIIKVQQISIIEKRKDDFLKDFAFDFVKNCFTAGKLVVRHPFTIIKKKCIVVDGKRIFVWYSEWKNKYFFFKITQRFFYVLL